MTTEAFLQAFPADDDVRQVEGPFLDYAREHVPAVLADLWEHHGLGWYGQQRLKLVDPAEWMPVLAVWIGADSPNVPFAISSFGHIYHYEITPTGVSVQVLDPHFANNEVVADDLAHFFNVHLAYEQSHLRDLEAPRAGAQAKFGQLANAEVYAFEPPIALGGQVSPDTLVKTVGPNYVGRVHQELAEQRS